jgi:hypothetical protein
LVLPTSDRFEPRVNTCKVLFLNKVVCFSHKLNRLWLDCARTCYL